MFENIENRAALSAMLNHNRKALRGLHVIAGYDFEKPFSVRRFECPVTVARILKETGAAGSMHDLCVYLLVHCLDGSTADFYKKFHMARVIGPKEIDIDFRHDPEFIVYHSGIDHFFQKGSFEDLRKNPGSVIYAIIQKKEFLHKYTPKAYDLGDRFRLVPGKERKWTDGKGFHGVSAITVQRMDASGQNLEISRQKIYFGGRVSDEGNPASVSDFIDKSGYLLPWRRDEMKRRALALRKEKEKAAYMQTDNSGKIEEIAARIEKIKKALAEEVLQSVSYDDVCKVARRLGHCKGLASVVNCFELFQKYTIEKSFSSIAASEASYQRIVEELEGLEEKQAEE